MTINGDLILGFVAKIREEKQWDSPTGNVTQDGLNLAEAAMFVTEMANQGSILLFFFYPHAFLSRVKNRNWEVRDVGGGAGLQNGLKGGGTVHTRRAHPCSTIHP